MITLQFDRRNAVLKGVDWPVLDHRLLLWPVVLDVEVGEEDDCGVGGQEDEDVPGTVEVREPHRHPHVAKHSETETQRGIKR